MVSEETVRSAAAATRTRNDWGKGGEGCRKRVVAAGPLAFAKLQAVASQAQAIWEERKSRGSGRSERASDSSGRTTRDFSKGFQTLRRKPRVRRHRVICTL